MTPTSTYRLQVRASFDLDAAAEVTGYLRDLGVGWVYLSPILQAATGSDHGYDVVDPTRVDGARGGEAALDRFAAAARAAGLGILVDIVPNHQGVAVPAENPWWWDVLTHGRASEHATAFDIDWDHGGGRLVLPMLGGEADAVIAAGEITVAPPGFEDAAGRPVAGRPVAGSAAEESSAKGEFGTARYFDLVLPLAPGTAPLRATSDPAAVRDVLARQHWALVSWREDGARLNYRRFFTITSLAGVRVEVPEVFEASHVEILRWVRERLVDGLRIDHPDGLADPGGYLDVLADAVAAARAQAEARAGAQAPVQPHAAAQARAAAQAQAAAQPQALAHAAGAAPAPHAAPVYVEKILEPGEELPESWATDGTTGYDALGEIDRVLVDPSGEPELTALDERLRGHPVSWDDLTSATRREVADTAQAAEVRRIVRCLPAAVRAEFGDARARDAVAELLAAFPVYRAYLPAGREHVDDAVTRASLRRPDLADALAVLAPLVAEGGGAGEGGTGGTELSRRFMQTTGPVRAKGIEDRAFYRYPRLTSLTEVGGDPSRFALPVAGFHAAFARRQASWPRTLTALTTHDTKRSEDVRARLSALAEVPARWARTLDALRAIASTGDGPLDALLWQAVVGAWQSDPALPERLRAYAEKAAREGAVGTSWESPDAAFEARVRGLVDAAFGAARPVVEEIVDDIRGAGRSNSLAAKVLQLAGPGVPDVYQGTELWDLSLVDPDNRRSVDFAARRALLARTDAGWMPEIDDSGAAKLLVTSRALRLRRDRPDLFTGYTPLRAVGAAEDHAIAFDRGGAIAVATRLPIGLAARGGWGDTTVTVPSGTWRDEFTGWTVAGGAVLLGEVLHRYPVALLVRDGAAPGR